MRSGEAAMAKPDDNQPVRIPEELTAQAERFGGRVAIDVDGGGQLTYQQWDERASAAARGMAAKGVGKGDRVSLLMPTADAIEFAVGYVAAHRAGAAAVPINPRYARREIDHIVADCTPRLVLEAGDLAEIEAAGKGATPLDVDVSDDDIA